MTPVPKRFLERRKGIKIEYRTSSRTFAKLHPLKSLAAADPE